MLQQTAIRSLAIFLGLVLLSLLLTFAAQEYERSMAFQWENMVQPHWEGAVPHQTQLLLPASQAQLAIDDNDDVAEEKDTRPDTKAAVVVAKPIVVKPIVEKPVVTTTAIKPIAIKPIAIKHAVTKPAITKPVVEKLQEKKPPAEQPVAVKTNNTSQKLKLHVPNNLYKGRTAKWEEKKPRVMPDFFTPKPVDDSVQLGGHLIFEDDDNLGGKKKQEPDADYLDAIKGAEVNVKVKMF